MRWLKPFPVASGQIGRYQWAGPRSVSLSANCDPKASATIGAPEHDLIVAHPQRCLHLTGRGADATTVHPGAQRAAVIDHLQLVIHNPNRAMFAGHVVGRPIFHEVGSTGAEMPVFSGMAADQEREL